MLFILNLASAVCIALMVLSLIEDFANSVFVVVFGIEAFSARYDHSRAKGW